MGIFETKPEPAMVRELMKYSTDPSVIIRTVMINGKPWFMGKDVCEAFGDTNYRRSLRSLDADEKGVSQITTRGGKQSMTVINESGMYSLLLSMQPQKAKGVSQNDGQVNARIEQLKAFRHWVTHDVLPSIRKYGMYIAPDVLEEISTSDGALANFLEEMKKGVSQSPPSGQTAPLPVHNRCCGERK